MKTRKNLIPVVALASLLTFGPFALASTTSAGKYDSQIQASVTQQLEKKSDFQNVKSTVEDGIVTLTGTVDTFRDKLDVANKARKSSKQVTGVRNLVEVAGNTVPDVDLAKKLSRSLSYDRVGYFDNAFNAIAIDVKDGVVTLNGQVQNYPARDSAYGLVANAKGVKDVVNNIQVLPTSIYDDDLRVRVYRAIYGDSVLSKYGADPAKPIRIVVDGGRIGLYGQVDNTMDKNVAGIRASSVFGGFTVDNHLTTKVDR
jgi:hyperosmotically inducible protein